MRIEDIERDLKEADESLKNGLSQLRQANYQESKRLLKSALSLLERSYDKQHPDIANCLKGLADSHYALDEYSEAALVYTRLSMSESNLSPQEQVSILFKLAKSYDKAKRFSEAVTTYRQAVAMGEQSLPSGHPLSLSCMEGFSQMLRRGGRFPEEAQKLEDRIKQLRLHYRDPGRITRDRLKALQATTGDGPKEDAGAQDTAMAKPNESAGKVGQMNDSIKNKARSTLTRLEALEAIDSVTDYEPLMPSVSPAVKNPVAKTTLNRLAALEASGALLSSKAPEPKSHDLSDIEKKRQESLGVKEEAPQPPPVPAASPEEVKAQMKHLRDKGTPGLTREAIMGYGTLAAGIIVLGSGYWYFSHMLSKTPEDLSPEMVARISARAPVALQPSTTPSPGAPAVKVVEDKDLIALPLSNPDDAPIAQTMQIMGKAVEKFYSTHKRYPENVQELSILDSRLSYTNPASGATDVPDLRVVPVANEKAVPSTVNFLEMGGSWMACPWPDNGKIQGCLLHPRNAGGDPANAHTMVIRGAGKDGQFVTMDGGQALLIVLTDGKITRMGPPSQKKAEKQNSQAPDEVVSDFATKAK